MKRKKPKFWTFHLFYFKKRLKKPRFFEAIFQTSMAQIPRSTEHILVLRRTCF